VDITPHRAALEALHEAHGPALIPIAQGVQRIFGFVPRNVLLSICRRLGIPASRAMGVLSFYSGFHLVPRGRSVVKVCAGTACHQRGAQHVAEQLAGALALPAEGGTTPDRSHTLEKVACVGCCSLAPVVVVDEALHASVTPIAAPALLAGADTRS
jgi:NADH-quinone oxidoreductase subunit E